MDTFQDRLRAKAREKGLQQKEIARRVGRTPPAVNHWFRSSVSPDAMLAELARILDVDPEWLLHGDLVNRRVEAPLVGGLSLNGQLTTYLQRSNSNRVGVPVPTRSKVFAVRVEDDSMAPVFRRGDLLILEANIRQPEECLGMDALVTLPDDDRQLLRRVMPGTKPGTVCLEAYNSSVVETAILGGRAFVARIPHQAIELLE